MASDTRVLLALMAAIYALVYGVVLVADVGDVDRRLNVSAWFSWHAAFLVILVGSAEAPSGQQQGQSTPYLSPLTSIVHFICSLAATLQAVGFFIWAVVLWARDPGNGGSGSPLDEPENFLGLMSAALGALAFVGALIVLLTVNNMFLAKRGHRLLGHAT